MALQVAPQAFDFGRTFLAGRQAGQEYRAGEQRNRLTELALQNAPAQQAAAQEAQQLQSKRNKLEFSQDQEKAVGTALGSAAIQMLEPLSNHDFDGATSILDQTHASLAEQGLQLPEGQLRQALAEKNLPAIQNILTGTIKAAQTRGWLTQSKADQAPDQVRIAEWYSKATPEQRAAFDKSRAKEGGGGNEYGQFLIQPDGSYAFGNRRTGAAQPVTMGGAPLRAFTADPTAQGAVAQARESGQVAGKAHTEAQINLPSVIAGAEQTVSLIDDALKHPGLNSSTGVRGAIPSIPGTDARDFEVLLDQLKGKTFLEAFNSLKGAGAITDVEGRKGEEAIGRLNRSQSTEEFKKSLGDLRDIVNAGKVRSQVKAGQIARRSTDQQPAAEPTQQPAAPSQPTRLRFNPQTGELE